MAVLAGPTTSVVANGALGDQPSYLLHIARAGSEVPRALSQRVRLRTLT
jgi:hypothetical protein